MKKLIKNLFSRPAKKSPVNLATDMKQGQQTKSEGFMETLITANKHMISAMSGVQPHRYFDIDEVRADQKRRHY